MKKNLKRIIFSVIDKQKFYKYRRFLIKLLSFKKDIISQYNVTSFGNKSSDTFFGYYDISPFQDNKVIYISVDKNSDEANVILRNLDTAQYMVVGKTLAWNWQQGSRLRGVPNQKDYIMYNSFENEQFITKFVNTLNGSVKKLDWPLYDVDSNGRYGLTLDFLRLGKMRPGYGYTNTPYVEPESLNEEGISIVDIINKTSKKVITYELIAEMMNESEKNSSYKKGYINHLSFSPSGKKFLFFWIQIRENKIHHANLLVYNIEKSELTVLEKELSVSHYDWIDDDSILVTAYDKNRECKYYVYDIDGNRKDFLHDILIGDGHPTCVGENEIITDTYVDKNGYQKILYVDLKENKVIKLIDIYSTYKHYGEKRCDLHPRINSDTLDICFDADVKGHRKIYLLKGWKKI